MTTGLFSRRSLLQASGEALLAWTVPAQAAGLAPTRTMRGGRITIALARRSSIRLLMAGL